MSTCLERYRAILHQLSKQRRVHALSLYPPRIVAVSKRQPEARIAALLDAGHRDFGENLVQEAEAHWQTRRDAYPDLKLHLIGPLQSNKVTRAVALFDSIHSVDREKIARAIGQEQARLGKNLSCFIQINGGDEPQKAGIAPVELTDFIDFCRTEAGLSIDGLMTIPPAGAPSAPFFALMKKLADRHGLPELSMGMSDDYEIALRFGATYIRLGTALFGPREKI